MNNIGLSKKLIILKIINTYTRLIKICVPPIPYLKIPTVTLGHGQGIMLQQTATPSKQRL